MLREIKEVAARAAWIDGSGIRSILPPQALPQLRLCVFEKGEAFCRQEDEFSYLFFLLRGHYKLTRLTDRGEECLLNFFEAFSLIGELELLRSGTARTNAVALDESVCLRLPCAPLRETLLGDVAFLRFLCSYLGYKTAQRSQNLTLSLSSSVSQRAASYILATARGGVFRDNHTHLAEFLGCSHRQLLRVLGRLCEQGILCRLEGGGYRVADAARLSSLSGGVYVAEPFTYPGLGLRMPDTSAETKR